MRREARVRCPIMREGKLEETEEKPSCPPHPKTCLLRRCPHFRKLSRAVLRVYLSQVLTLLLS